MVEASRQKSIRRPAVAGSFYPRDATALAVMVDEMLERAATGPDERIRAVIAPHAGYIYSGSVAAEAFAGLTAIKRRLSRVIVIGPAHFVPFDGIAAPAAAMFATPMGAHPVDRKAIGEIADLPKVVIDDRPHAPDHALEVELPFLMAMLNMSINFINPKAMTV